MNTSQRTAQPGRSAALGLLGAAVGGALGYFAFGWIVHQGFFAAALPGALLGAGCGLLVRHRSVPLAITCGLAALTLGIFSDWHILYKHYSLQHFLSHLHQLPPVELLLLALGGVLGFWFALGRRTATLPVARGTEHN